MGLIWRHLPQAHYSHGGYADTSADGSSNGSLPGFHGNVGSRFAVMITRAMSPAPDAPLPCYAATGSTIQAVAALFVSGLRKVGDNRIEFCICHLGLARGWHDRYSLTHHTPDERKRNLESLGEPVRALVLDQIDELRGAQRFDYVNDFTAKVTAKILFRMLGLPPGDDQEVRERAVLMVQSDPAFRQKGPDHIAAYNWMQDYAAGVIAERRRQPREDLISQLCLSEIDGERLQEREVLLTITTLIMAGIESLGGFTTMFGLNLADFPEARRELVADPSLIPDAIEESLRFNTSAQRFRRCLTRDVTLHGQTMREGQFVCMAYGSGNRDERQYPPADTYDIRRKPRGHLGFGGGVHACLGSMGARMAVRIIMEEFLQAFPEFSRVQKALPWMPSTTFRSPIRLEIAVH